MLPFEADLPEQIHGTTLFDNIQPIQPAVLPVFVAEPLRLLHFIYSVTTTVVRVGLGRGLVDVHALGELRRGLGRGGLVDLCERASGRWREALRHRRDS